MATHTCMFREFPEPRGEYLYLRLNRVFKSKMTNDEITEWWGSLCRECGGDVKEMFIPTTQQLDQLRTDFCQQYQHTFLDNLQDLTGWFRLNPHLPQPPEFLVSKFLWSAKGDVEQAKKMLTRYFSLRGTDDNVFSDRNPSSEAQRKLMKSSTFVCLPGFTEDLYRVTLSALISHDPDDFQVVEWMKRLFYLSDIRTYNDFCLGDIIIYDFKGFSLSHLVKWTPSLIKKMTIAVEGGLPARIKQVHLINCPGFIDRMLAMFKPFMKEKLQKRIFTHMNGLQDIYKYVPREMLPKEYGGDAGSMAQLNEQLMATFEEHKEWFHTEEARLKRIYTEAKKQGKLFVDCGELYGMEGSFKKLVID